MALSRILEWSIMNLGLSVSLESEKLVRTLDHMTLTQVMYIRII